MRRQPAPTHGVIRPRRKYSLRTQGKYDWDDRRYDSVTSIVDVMDKPAIPRWAANEVANFVAWQLKRKEEGLINGQALAITLADRQLLAGVPWMKRDWKMEIGSAVHDIAERWALDGMRPTSVHPVVKPYSDALLEWLSKNRPVYYFAEATVISKKYGYAGTMDAILGLGDELLLVDYKSSRDTWPAHALQLAAYRHADCVVLPVDDYDGNLDLPPGAVKVKTGYEVPLPKTDGGRIMLIQPHGVAFMRWDCAEEEFQTFLHLYEVKKWLDKKKRPTEVSFSPTVFKYDYVAQMEQTIDQLKAQKQKDAPGA